jgi:hypothetical protein
MHKLKIHNLILLLFKYNISFFLKFNILNKNVFKFFNEKF